MARIASLFAVVMAVAVACGSSTRNSEPHSQPAVGTMVSYIDLHRLDPRVQACIPAWLRRTYTITDTVAGQTVTMPAAPMAHYSTWRSIYRCVTAHVTR